MPDLETPVILTTRFYLRHLHSPSGWRVWDFETHDRQVVFQYTGIWMMAKKQATIYALASGYSNLYVSP